MELSMKCYLIIFFSTLIFQNCLSISDIKLIKTSDIGFSYKASRSSGSDALHSFSVQKAKLEAKLVSGRFTNLSIKLSKFKPNEFIIFPTPFPELLKALKSPLSHVTTYLVFRPKEDTYIENEYSGHVAYIRTIQEDKSVEWSYIENVIPNGSFVSAFLIEPLKPPTHSKDSNALLKVFGHPKIYQNASKSISGRSMGSSRSRGQHRRYHSTYSDNDVGYNNERQDHYYQDDYNLQKRSAKSEKHHKSKQNSSKDAEVEIFKGLGTCPKIIVEINATTFWQLDTRVSYYMNILGVSCDPLFANDMKDMIKEGLVSEGVDFKYVMNLTHPYFTSDILDPKEWSSLISAIFLDVFSNSHSEQTENVVLNIHDNQSPTTKTISRTARTMTIFVFKILYLMGSHFYYHTVKIVNTVIEVLAVMIKTISDQDTSEVRKNDQLQLAALIGFLQNDLLSTLTVGEYEIPEFFNEHFIKNLDLIETSLSTLLLK